MSSDTPCNALGTVPPTLWLVLAVALAVAAKRYLRKTVVLLDWDLTLDCISTPGDKRVTKELRRAVRQKIGMSDAQEMEYMASLFQFLNRVLVAGLQQNITFVITTRNDAENVKWMLKNVVKLDPSKFIVLSDKEKEYDNKVELIQEHFGIGNMTGVCVLVDDSNSEHEAAAEYATENCPDMTLRHVRVARPKRGAAYERQYGMMNQHGVLKELESAISPLNLS